MTLALALALALAAMTLRSPVDSLIFFPDRTVGEPPAGAAEDTFETADGVRLHAWHAPAAAGRATLLWSHGNGGNVHGRGDVLALLHRRGIGVFAYDYRGYGKSEGRPSEPGVYADAEAAYDHLVASGVAGERIVGFGESLGGAVTLRLATRRPLRAAVVVSTFTDLETVGRLHYGPFARLVAGRFDSRALVAGLRVPLLVAHGDRDEIVPFALGRELFEAAREPKRFLAVPGAGHNDVFAFPVLLDAVDAFLTETVERPAV